MKRILREPLLHFALLGAALFALYSLLTPSREMPDEVIVSEGQIKHLIATFSGFHQRSPAPDELKGLIDEYVREEILSREAIKLGLDRNDSIIRRRLQQKMEFVATDLVNAIEPTDEELTAWLANHPGNFRQEGKFSFRQLYLDPNKHGDHLEQDAAKLIADLSAADSRADLSGRGDPFLLPDTFESQGSTAIADQFGKDFVAALTQTKTDAWTGPITSTYGLHLVFVTSRTESRLPTLSEVREQVKRDLLSERRLEANRHLLDELLTKYTVKIDWPDQGPAEATKEIAAVP